MSTLVLSETKTYTRDALHIFTGTAFLALCSQLSLTVPFTAIPFSIQPHAVLFLAACLGPQRGLMCILLYLLEGVMGLPVFSHGRSTILHLLSPSGGYLLSYIPVSYFVGHLLHSGFGKHSVNRFWCLLAGNALTLLMGTLWLSGYVGLPAAFALGFIPFIATDLIKTLVVNFLLKEQFHAQNSQFSTGFDS